MQMGWPQKVKDAIMQKDTQRKSEVLGYDCPRCDMPAVTISGVIPQLHCMACGWSMSAGQWNKLSDQEKKAIRRRKPITQKIKEKLTK